MAGFSFVLNPTSDPEVTHTAQLDLSDGAASNGVGYRVLDGAQLPPPSAKPAYASSYDTEGSVSSDEAHYDNREITLPVRVVGSSAANLEAKLNALSKMVGQINREGGSLKFTTPNGTVGYFDLERETAAMVNIDGAYAGNRRALVECRLVARPFWRGAEVSLGTISETTLPALVATFGTDATWVGAVTADSPVLWWRLGEAAGAGTVQDETANNRDGTPGAGITLGVAGLLVGDANTAASFSDAAGSSIPSTYAVTSASVTVLEAWVNRANTGDEDTIWGSSVGAGTAWKLAFASGSNDIVFNPAVGTATANTWTNAASAGAVHHIVLVYNMPGNTAELYVDGVSQGSQAQTTDWAGSGSNFVLGGNAGAAFFQGTIDEAVIYLASLSAARVLAHYNAGAGLAIAIDGDVPALGRLVITDTESGGKDRWTVIIAGDSRWYSSAATNALFYQAEDLTEVGTTAVAVGATGASGSGSNVQRNTDLTTTYQAILKSEIDATNAALTHKGTFRVWARLYRPTGNTGAVSVRLEWAEGDFTRVTQNDPVSYAADDREGVFTWANLGIVSIDPESTRWEFRLLAKSTVAGDELDADCFVLFPTEVTYIELSGRLVAQNPTSFLALSTMDTESGAITGDSATVGGVWAGAGDADDFSAAAGIATRAPAATDADANTGRYLVSGMSAAAAQVVQVDFKYPVISLVSAVRWGLLARYTDTSNWIFAGVGFTTSPSNPFHSSVMKRVGGTVTEIWDGDEAAYTFPENIWYRARLQVDAAGRWFFWFGPRDSALPLVTSGYDTAFATGGALATGKAGIYDAIVMGGSADPRSYDNFLAFAPATDAAIFAGQSLTLSHDGATREDSTGTFPSKISDRRGRYLKIPPAGPEGRSTRLVILALPNDPYTMGDAAAIYDLSAQLFVTPRGLVIPEA